MVEAGGVTKGCWRDDKLLPSQCYIDMHERWNCRHATEYNTRYDCHHWNEVLSLELAQEIVGPSYKIVRAENE